MGVNRQRLTNAERDRQIAKVRDAYDDKHLSGQQLDRAVREIRSGTCCDLLRDFLDGQITPQTFGILYVR